jgi:hypothetical protein
MRLAPIAFILLTSLAIVTAVNTTLEVKKLSTEFVDLDDKLQAGDPERNAKQRELDAAAERQIISTKVHTTEKYFRGKTPKNPYVVGEHHRTWLKIHKNMQLQCDNVVEECKKSYKQPGLTTEQKAEIKAEQTLEEVGRNRHQYHIDHHEYELNRVRLSFILRTASANPTAFLRLKLIQGMRRRRRKYAFPLFFAQRWPTPLLFSGSRGEEESTPFLYSSHSVGQPHCFSQARPQRALAPPEPETFAAWYKPSWLESSERKRRLATAPERKISPD